jgi:hypothetical protein
MNIKRGDLVFIGNPVYHVPIVYCTQDDDPNGRCASDNIISGEYNIIHSSGDYQILYGKDYTNIDSYSFNRKVVINKICSKTLGTLKNPTGFGRIMLWD